MRIGSRLFSLPIIILSSLLLSGTVAFADSYTFSLLPASGQIQGAPGSVIGWGYTLTNNSSTQWLEALSVNAGLFQNASLDSADYFDFPLIAPNATVTVSFAAAGASGFGAGLAALTWSAGAPSGFVNSGSFDLGACWANSSGTCLGSAPDAFASYSATAVSTPEPSAIALFILAIFTFSFLFSVTRVGGSPSDRTPFLP